MTHDLEFEQWANKVWNFGSGLGAEVSLKDFRKDIIIEVYNEAGQLALAYKVFRCWVSEYQALPDLDANANAVAIEHMESNARVHVLPTPMPELQPSPGVREEPDLVVAICGWGLDEPIDELIESARGRPWRLVLTGRPRRQLARPPNVQLSGFLADQEYIDLLASAAAVVVLTTRDETLLAGAWEALALGRPLVLSDTPSLRSMFGGDITLVGHNAPSIGNGIASVLADRTVSASASRRVYRRHQRAGAMQVSRLRATLGR